ncbi:MAG: DNA repair protein RecO [Rudaea sp.]|nr:DNA repair protein RecO [Rudaea sp.]
MRVEQQPGFVLHGRAYRETSLLLECMSRDHGRVALVARGMRREKARTPRALLQPLTPVLMSWSGRGDLATLTAIEAAGTPIVLAGEALLCALYLNELVARMTQRHDPHPPLFADYVETLGRLARGDPPAWTLRRFERDLLTHLGYGLLLEAEAESGATLDPQHSYGYRHEFGPVPWRGNDDGLKLRGTALLALAHDQMPDADDLATLRRLLRALIAHHLEGAGLRAWGMLEEVPVPAPMDA